MLLLHSYHTFAVQPQYILPFERQKETGHCCRCRRLSHFSHFPVNHQSINQPPPSSKRPNKAKFQQENSTRTPLSPTQPLFLPWPATPYNKC